MIVRWSEKKKQHALHLILLIFDFKPVLDSVKGIRFITERDVATVYEDADEDIYQCKNTE